MNTHDPMIANTFLWFTMLSPVIVLIVSLLGAWVTQLIG